MRSRMVVLLTGLWAATATADAPPPQVPTLYLALDASSLRGQAATLAAAVKAALPRVAKGSVVVVVGSDASSPLAPTRRDEIGDALTNRSAGSASLSAVIARAVSDWQGAKLRHHIVALTGGSPTLADVESALGSATGEGFTVSFVSLGKVAAKEKTALQRRGAGRVWAVNARSLTAALRSELGWARLTAAQEKALTAAAVEYSTSRRAALAKALAGKGILKILGAKGSGSGGVADVLGTGAGTFKVSGVIGRLPTGGLGVKGSGGSVAIGGLGYANPRLRRSESLIGPKLALTFRQVSGGEDLAELRRYLLAQARPLLGCFEGKLALTGRDEATVEFTVGGKIGGTVPAATACVQAWAGKLRRGLRATVLVGVASSAQ